MSYPWDTEALGLTLPGVASGVGTASVVCGVWEHEDPLTTAALFVPAVSIVPQEQTLTSPRSWGYESVALCSFNLLGSETLADSAIHDHCSWSQIYYSYCFHGGRSKEGSAFLPVTWRCSLPSPCHPLCGPFSFGSLVLKSASLFW